MPMVQVYKQREVNLCFAPHSPPPSLPCSSHKPLVHDGVDKRWRWSTQRWQPDLPSHGVCTSSARWLSCPAASVLSMRKFIVLSLLKDASEMVLQRHGVACCPRPRQLPYLQPRISRLFRMSFKSSHRIFRLWTHAWNIKYSWKK